MAACSVLFTVATAAVAAAAVPAARLPSQSPAGGPFATIRANAAASSASAASAAALALLRGDRTAAFFWAASLAMTAGWETATAGLLARLLAAALAGAGWDAVAAAAALGGSVLCDGALVGANARPTLLLAAATAAEMRSRRAASASSTVQDGLSSVGDEAGSGEETIELARTEAGERMRVLREPLPERAASGREGGENAAATAPMMEKLESEGVATQRSATAAAVAQGAERVPETDAGDGLLRGCCDGVAGLGLA